MFIIRWLLGRIILGLNYIFTPRSPKRTQQEQLAINEQTKHLTLYQLPACPFCVKVRRAMKRKGLKFPIVSIKEALYRDELVAEGGKHKAPCLKIEKPNEPTLWMYESSDIVTYLDQFA